MRILLLGLALVKVFAEFDPFDYGGDSYKSGEIKLYGFMGERVNLNGKWYPANATFESQEGNFRIVGIRNPCVFLQEIHTQKQSKVCLQESKLLRK